MNIVPIFEDNHLLVLNKPAGLLTQPSGTDQDSLEQRAKTWLKEVHCKPGNVFLHAIHRLDRAVSGVVVFCKTSKALARLNEAIRQKSISKIYWAWVAGSPPNEDQLEHYLLHDDHRATVVRKDHPEGKKARLSFRTIQRKDERALLEIELETGRYHQIRAQLSSEGYPILGDRKYGGKRWIGYDEDRIALHHRRMEIPHPITGEKCVFEAPLPPEFE